MTNWIVRIGDTKNFFNTFEGLNVWSVNSFYTKFLENVKKNDSKWDYIMFYTNYVDFRNIPGVNLNTNINNKNCHAIMPRSIIDASGFNFDNVIVFAENYNICKFLEEIR